MSLIVPESFTETDPVFSAAPASGIVAGDISNWNTAYGWGNHAAVGYLTSFTETDPVFSAAPASGIAAGDISNWNTAYGWGDHATAGYLTTQDLNFATQSVTYNDGGTSTINAADGGNFFFSLTANGASTTIAVSNVPTTGTRYGLELHLTWTAGAITFPASWSKGDALPSATGDYVITAVTVDGGTSFKIAVLTE